jgi:hypothetical protein
VTDVLRLHTLCAIRQVDEILEPTEKFKIRTLQKTKHAAPGRGTLGFHSLLRSPAA